MTKASGKPGDTGIRELLSAAASAARPVFFRDHILAGDVICDIKDPAKMDQVRRIMNVARKHWSSLAHAHARDLG